MENMGLKSTFWNKNLVCVLKKSSAAISSSLMLSISSYLDYLESGPQQQSEPHLPNPALTSFRTRQQNPSGTTAAPQGRGWPRHATLENSSKHRVDIREIFHTARVPFIFHSSSTERFSAKRNLQRDYPVASTAPSPGTSSSPAAPPRVNLPAPGLREQLKLSLLSPAHSQWIRRTFGLRDGREQTHKAHKAPNRTRFARTANPGS